MDNNQNKKKSKRKWMLYLGIMFILSSFSALAEGEFAVAIIILVVGLLLMWRYKQYNKILKISELEEQANILREDISNKEALISELNKEISEISKEKSIVEAELDDVAAPVYSGIYPTEFEFEHAESYKLKLKNLREEQKALIKNGEATEKIDNIEIDGKKNKGNQLLKRIERLMLRAFNIEADNLVSQVTYANYETKKNQLIRALDVVNKQSYENIVLIKPDYLDLKLQELELAYLYKAKIEEEKEILREEREKQREEAKARQEIQQKQKVIDEEISKLEIAKNKLNEKIESAQDEELKLLRQQLLDLESRIHEFEDDKEELDFRIENTGAGYVYVISNIGSFGEKIFKIGVTRRLDPYDRIAELSSASVPFKFDVHAMIFSYDAYSLESELHKHFDDKRVNKVNPRKEFFNVELSEIKKVLDNHEELTFDYEVEAKAEEYRESLKLSH